MRRTCYGKLGPNQKKLAFLFCDSLRGLSVGEQNTKIKSIRECRTKQTRPGPATRAASYVVSCSALSPLSGGMTASARQRSKGVPPHLPKPVADPSPCDHESTTATVGQRPCPAPRSRMGRRPQRLGNQSRLRAFSGFPPAIHPRESPAAAGSAAIIRQAQELSRFAANTLSQIVAPRNRKKRCSCAETVEDRTSLWKTEEN
jgi:hypothetical protein